MRQQTWSTLWEMVRASRLRSTDYLAAVRRFAPAERDRSLVQSITDRAMVAQRRYLPDGAQDEESRALTAMAIEAMLSTDDPDLCLLWARSAAGYASAHADILRLLDLIDEGWSPTGDEPDQQLRWVLAVKAAAYGLDDDLVRVEMERTHDHSDRGQRAAIRAEVSRPSPEVKASAWARIHGEGYGSDYLTRAAVTGFQWPHQRDILLAYRAPFYEQVRKVYRARDHAYAQSYLHWLVPDLWAEASELERLRAFALELTPEEGLLRRHLTEVADDLARDIRVRAYAAQGLVGAV
jgi:aminopeptidase N